MIYLPRNYMTDEMLVAQQNHDIIAYLHAVQAAKEKYQKEQEAIAQEHYKRQMEAARKWQIEQDAKADDDTD